MTNLQKKLNNVKGDEVDVIDGVEAEAVVETLTMITLVSKPLRGHTS